MYLGRDYMITDHQYGLKRIILIDSFLPGRRYIVDVAGNTGITGDNGMGKTSLIRLPVIFYGERPVKIGIKQNPELKLKGFSGWYLPRNGSYVVFEYLSEGEKRCAVFLPDANTEEGVCRHFIETGYEDALFFDETIDRPYTKEQFLKNLTLQNIRHHSPHSFEQYRKILLDGDVKGLKHFSMVPSGSKLSQLHELFGGMLKRETDFSMLCKIIESWAHKGIGEDSRAALSSFSLDRSKLKSWIVEYEAQKKLQKRASRETIKSAKAKFEEYKYSCAKIGKIVNRAESWKDTLVLDLKDQKKTFDEKISSIKLLLDENQATIKSLNDEIQTLSSKTSSRKAELTSLNTQKLNYETKIGDNYQSRLNELEDCRKQLKFCRSQKDTLNDAAVKIESWFKDEKRELEKRFEDDKNVYQAQINTLDSDKKDADHLRSMQHQKAIVEIKETFASNRKLLDKQIEKIERDIIRIETACLNPQCPDELKIRKDNLLLQRDQLSEQIGLLNDERDKCSRKKNQEHSIFENLNKTLTQQDTSRDEIEADLEGVTAKLNANENSLLTFVKNNVDDWENTFGRTLRKDVLLKTNLKPTLSSSNTDTVFGVNFDTALLPPAEEFNQDTLLEEQKKLISELNQLESDFKQTETKLKQTLIEEDKARKDLEKNESQISILKPKISDNRGQLSRIDNEINNWLEKYQDDAKLEIAEKTSAIDEINHKLVELDSQLKNKTKETEEAFNLTKTNADTVFRTAKDAIQKDIDQLEAKALAASHSLNETYETKLNEKGVNPGLLEKLDLEIMENIGKVDELTKLQELVYAFKNFMEEDYSEFSNIEKVYKEYSDQLLKSTKYKEELRSIKEKLVDEQSDAKTSYTIKNTQINSDITTLNALLKDNSYNPILTSEDVLVTIDDVSKAYQLKMMYDETIKARDNAEQSTLELLKPIKKVFTDENHHGTSLHLYFSNNPTNTTSLVGLATLIFNYIDNDLQKNDVRILRNNLNDLDKLNNYVSYINSFGNKIAEFSRNLDRHMEQISSFESLERLTATIYFSLMDEQSWKDMKALSDSYKAWRDQESGSYELGELKAELPSEELFNSIQDYVENASSQELSTEDLAHFIDFRIEFEDQGTLRRVKSHKLLKQASSNARSYLILVVIFIGFVNMVRGKHATPLVWAVDELRDISVNNIEKLVDLLGVNNISLISACPDVDEHIFDIFDKIYEIYKLEQGGTVFAEIVPDTADLTLELESF